MLTDFVLNNLLRHQGSAACAMVGIGAGGMLNILLDTLFIFAFGMGNGGGSDHFSSGDSPLPERHPGTAGFLPHPGRAAGRIAQLTGIKPKAPHKRFLPSGRFYFSDILS